MNQHSWPPLCTLLKDPVGVSLSNSEVSFQEGNWLACKFLKTSFLQGTVVVGERWRAWYLMGEAEGKEGMVLTGQVEVNWRHVRWGHQRANKSDTYFWVTYCPASHLCFRHFERLSVRALWRHWQLWLLTWSCACVSAHSVLGGRWWRRFWVHRASREKQRRSGSWRWWGLLSECTSGREKHIGCLLRRPKDCILVQKIWTVACNHRIM